jgi:hypothetical protein
MQRGLAALRQAKLRPSAILSAFPVEAVSLVCNQNGSKRNIMTDKSHWGKGVNSILLMALICLLCAGACVSSLQPVPRVVTFGDLMDEKFGLLKVYGSNETRLSGWDLEKSGGSFDYSYYNWFKINDTNDSAPFIMKKRFVKQTMGKTTWEFNFRLTNKMDGVKWQLRNGDTPVVVILTDAEDLCYEKPGGQPVRMFGYDANREYSVRVIADISVHRAAIYVDGELQASEVPFCNPSKALDNVYIKTGDKATGEMYLGPVFVHTGFNVRERFIIPRGSIPSDWTMSAKGGSVLVREIDGVQTEMDKNGLLLADKSSSENVSATKTFSSVSRKLVFMYSFMIPVKTDDFKMLLRNGNDTAIEITTIDGNLCYVDHSGKNAVIWNNYKANLWYDVKVVANPITLKADVYINTMKKAVDIGFRNIVKQFDNIRFETPVNGKGTLWFDDVVVHEYLPYPDDYVPEPIVVNTGNYMIGMQSCDLWREGGHSGWDFIKDYESERKPFLGWYNGGDSEVEDWAVKWMAENGIRFDFKCWYRLRKGVPIQSTPHNEALNAYRYGRWSNKVSYAINLTNHDPFGVSDMNDWKQNVVPYLIEHYFIDPRYQKIENKPILGIFDPEKFNIETGDAAKAIEYLRSECKKAGLDGLVCMGQCWDVNKEKLTKFKQWGIDYLYAYTWLATNANGQKEKLNAQKNLGAIEVLPTLSMGWDLRAWGGKKKEYWLPPSEFQGLLQWGKETFMASYPSNSLASKVVMLDNWNEFGEGHFIMPSNLYGFGYINAVRNIFGRGEFPPNVVPTKKQKARMDTLYPKGDW